MSYLKNRLFSIYFVKFTFDYVPEKKLCLNVVFIVSLILLNDDVTDKSVMSSSPNQRHVPKNSSFSHLTQPFSLPSRKTHLHCHSHDQILLQAPSLSTAVTAAITTNNVPTTASLLSSSFTILVSETNLIRPGAGNA